MSNVFSRSQEHKLPMETERPLLSELEILHSRVSLNFTSWAESENKRAGSGGISTSAAFSCSHKWVSSSLTLSVGKSPFWKVFEGEAE